MTAQVVIFLRAEPGKRTLRRLDQAVTRNLGQRRQTLVFLHGDAVSLAVDNCPERWRSPGADRRLELQVCTAAWQRRHPGRKPASGWQRASLVGLWDRLLRGADIDCLVDCKVQPAQPEGTGAEFLIEVSAAPAEPGSTEMLELVLAGASLDAQMQVLFRGAGVAHLDLPDARAWQQLHDFELARLFHAAGARPEGLMPALPSIGLDSKAMAALAHQARAVIYL